MRCKSGNRPAIVGTGDWNDGMNRVGQKGKGESVWLGWLAIHRLTGSFSLYPIQHISKVWLASWFGIDLERPDICPAPWWIVVAGALVAAQVVVDRRRLAVRPLGLVGLPDRLHRHQPHGVRHLQVEAPCRAAAAVSRRADDDRPVGARRRAGDPGDPHHRAGTAASDVIESCPPGRRLSIGEPLNRHSGDGAPCRSGRVSFFATALTLQSKAGGALAHHWTPRDMIRRRVAVKSAPTPWHRKRA